MPDNTVMPDNDGLRPLVFQILLLLGEGEAHGYAIMQQVNERTGRRTILGPATLYRTLKQLREDGLIEEAGTEPGDGGERRKYRLTSAGRRAAHDEAARMADLVQRARATRLLR